MLSTGSFVITRRTSPLFYGKVPLLYSHNMRDQVFLIFSFMVFLLKYPAGSQYRVVNIKVQI